MEVKATMQFDDLQENVKRKKGDIFEVSKERAEFLFSHNAVEFVGIEEDKEAEKVEINEFGNPIGTRELKEVKTNKSKKRKKK